MIGDMETSFLGFPGGASGKPVIARDLRDADSIPGSVLSWEDPVEEGMATHSSIHVGKIPWTEEPGRLQSMRLQRIRHT